ncbi:MAG: polysaccharide biosynthesis protein [Desulfosporosinus sp.]|nr:polysaccharide biosynthesis protein [Desulfosporosinus sp.]
MICDNKNIVITGGTVSLGKVLARRLLTGEFGLPKKVIIFSRDEAKQHAMRVEYEQTVKQTDAVLYENFTRLLEFRIGDIRDFHAVSAVLKEAEIVINAAALKQVPSCEYFPFEAVQTNVFGAENIIRAIRENQTGVETVVGVSTDKACKPVNVMGISKALQERIFIAGNISVPGTRFICVRYGNVLASRGSVIPLFHEQIKRGGPVTVTTMDMTRFLLPLSHAVETIMAALKEALPGEIYIPKIPAALIIDVAKGLIGDRAIPIVYTGIRPGEKIDEVLVSEEEAWRTYDSGSYYAIQPLLPEIVKAQPDIQPLNKAYSSGDFVMNLEETENLLRLNGLLLEQKRGESEFLQ